MNIHQLKENLSYMLKNETDGFLATTLEPENTGLSAYMIFNCYGLIVVAGKCFLIPKKHRKMIVEAAKDIGKVAGTPCKRFNRKETIPVEVSESPKLLLKGRKLKWAHSVFSLREWEDIFCFIAENLSVIEWHWLNGDSFELFEAFGLIDKEGM